MTKRYYTTTKSGEEVEVDEILAKQLVAQGKKKVEDFEIEEYESPSEMRSRAKSEYETDVAAIKQQDVMDRQNQNPIMSSIYPRASKAENVAQMFGGGVLDVTSLPGRAAAALIGGAATGLGEKFIGDGEFLNPALDEASQIFGRKGGNEYAGFVPRMAESIVKDPLMPVTISTGGLMAGIGKLAPKLVSKSPAIVNAIASGLENVGIGALERGVDPNEKAGDISQISSDFTLGGLIGGVGHKGSEWLKGFGDTDIGRAILKKITPTKLQAGESTKLGKLIEEGFGVDVIDPKTGRPDAKKLGAWLAEQSRGSDILAESKYTRIPEWISNERAAVGNELGNIRKNLGKLDVEFDPKTGNAIITEPMKTNILKEIGLIDKQFSNPLDGETTLLSWPEIGKFKQEIGELLPNGVLKKDLITGESKYDKDWNLTPNQLQQLNEFLYNAGKESSLKYHPSKEQYAVELRKRISDIQQEILRSTKNDPTLPKKYAALKDLETLALKTSVLNPDRPAFFDGGVAATIGRGGKSLGAMAGELPVPAKRTAKEFFLQAQVRSESRTKKAPQDEAKFYQSLSSADQRVFMRAKELLRFNPSDTTALKTIENLVEQQGSK